MEFAGGDDRRVRPRAPRRDRPAARERDRAADRLRDARRRPRPHPARRHADRLRPGARDPVRGRRDRRRPRRALGEDAGAARRPKIELVDAGRGGGRAAHGRPRRSIASCRGLLRLAVSAAAAVALAARGAARSAAALGGGRRRRRCRPLTVYVSLPLRGPSAADGRDAADGARLALADAGGEAGGIAVEAIYLDDTAGAGRARWTPASAAANARARDPGLDRDRLPRRLRVRRHPRLAAGHQHRRACSRSRRRAPRATSSRRSRAPTSSRDPAERQAHLRPRDPERRAQARPAPAGSTASGVRRVATSPTGRRSATRWSPRFEDALGASRGPGAAELLYYGGVPDEPAGGAGPTARRLMVTDAELAPGVARAAGHARDLGGARPDRSCRPPAGEFAAAFERRVRPRARPLRRLRLRGDGGDPRLDRARLRPDRPRRGDRRVLRHQRTATRSSAPTRSTSSARRRSTG